MSPSAAAGGDPSLSKPPFEEKALSAKREGADGDDAAGEVAPEATPPFLKDATLKQPPTSDQAPALDCVMAPDGSIVWQLPPGSPPGTLSLPGAVQRHLGVHRRLKDFSVDLVLPDGRRTECILHVQPHRCGLCTHSFLELTVTLRSTVESALHHSEACVGLWGRVRLWYHCARRVTRRISSHEQPFMRDHSVHLMVGAEQRRHVFTCSIPSSGL